MNAIGDLTAGTESQVNDPGTADAQCEAGFPTGSAGSWPAVVDQPGDSESCSVQPQLGGHCCVPTQIGTDNRCFNPVLTAGQVQLCDFNPDTCPTGQRCAAARGFPKYGDYNGNACAAGRFFTAWASATSPPTTTPASTDIDIFFASFAVGPPFRTDLAITMTDNPDPVDVGGELTYRLRVRNLGPLDASGVVVSDTLPASVNFVSASSGCSRSSSTVTCNIGNMSDGESAVRLIRVRPTAPGGFSNTATVRANETDPDPANNTVTTVTTVK